MRDNEITHIIAVGYETPEHPSETVTTMCVNVGDKKDSDLLSFFGITNMFIRSAREAGSTVLVMW